MALKRLPADLTFEAVRNRASPLAKAPPKGIDMPEPQPEPIVGEAELKVEGKGPKKAAPFSREFAKAPDVQADRARPEPDQHGQRDADPTPEDKPTDQAASEGSEADIRPKDQFAIPPSIVNPDADRYAQAPVKAASRQAGTIVIKARIAAPADGVIEIYDLVKARYGEKAAFKHLLGLALVSYEAAVLAGDSRALAEQPAYASRPPSQATYRTRAVSKPFFEAVKATLDPIGIMGPSVFGTAIMKNAVAWYVATEAKKKA